MEMVSKSVGNLLPLWILLAGIHFGLLALGIRCVSQRRLSMSFDVTQSFLLSFSVHIFPTTLSYLFDDFWRHPEWRPYESVPFRGSVGDLSSDTKIRQLHFASLADQHIRRLSNRIPIGLAMATVDFFTL